MTNNPIKNVLRRPKLTGRMGKWAITLSGYDIKYLPRTVIKSQALADFVVEFSLGLEKIAKDEVAQINHVSYDA